MSLRPSDVWPSGAAYEQYVGRWSRLGAADFVTWLGRRKGASWLDIGCGTGVLTETILSLAEPASVASIAKTAAAFTALGRAEAQDIHARVQVFAGTGYWIPRPRT